MVQRYRARIPGPVLDRLDLSVRVPFVPAEQRRPSAEGLQLDVVRERVARIRQRQLERNVGVLNGRLCASRLERTAKLSPSAAAWLDRRIDRLRLSIRAHHRVLRVARTLADLAERGSVEKVDLARALALREP